MNRGSALAFSSDFIDISVFFLTEQDIDMIALLGFCDMTRHNELTILEL